MRALLWKCISRTELTEEWKERLFLTLHTVICGLLGLLLWFTFGKSYFDGSVEWLICFIGYPTWFAGFLMGKAFLNRNR